MSQYNHDLRKFADQGLQLRTPVDLVPATQYSRLTNALPVIEGELRTRDGMTFINSVAHTANVFLLTDPASLFQVSKAFTTNPHGFIFGDQISITIVYEGPNQASTITPGAYQMNISAINSPTSFSFFPPIPATLSSLAGVLVYAEATSTNPLTVLNDTVIDNIFRLNQAITSFTGDRIVAMAGRIFRAALPAGLVFFELTSPLAPAANLATTALGLSGRPLSIIEFRFTLDSPSWAIFADQNQMYKYRPGITQDQLEFVPLGNAPPTVMAPASAGGTGNLNSTGGPGYDWRYTYVDGYAFTESNPSPINTTGSSGGVSTTRPTTFTNPAVAGQTAFTNPGNAIDGSGTTSALGTASVTSSTSTVVRQVVSCLWNGWAQPAGVVDAVTLNVVASLFGFASGDGNGAGGNANALLEYSYDGGSTFHTLQNQSVNVTNNSTGKTFNTGKQTYSAVMPSSAGFSNFIVRATGTVVAIGQNFLGQGYTGNAQVTINVYDINTTVKQEAATTTLALTNQIGVVCVTPSPAPQHKFINLYRRGGSLPDNWRLVGQFQVSTLSRGACGVGYLEIDDNIGDAQLSGSAILELDNDQPVTSVTRTNQPLSFIWGPVGLEARVLGCGDPARPESVYFSKPGNADAWPPENFIEVSSPGTPIIAGCVFNTRTFAFSRESIYELVEGLGTGTTFTPFRTPSAHGLYSPWALALGPAMFFVAKDGIYMTTGGQETSIVENDIKPLFPTYDTPGQSVNGYEAVDMTQPDSIKLTYHNDELYFTYFGTTTATRQLLVYDLLKKRWRAMETSCGISVMYSEPATTSSLLYGTVAGSIYQAGGTFDPIELDVIEAMSIGSVPAGGVTIPPNSYFARVTRFGAAFEEAMSYEFGPLTVDASHAIQAVLPNGPPDTTKWRVYFGISSGLENQYVEFPESTVASLTRRTVLVTTPGTAGTLPTVNVNRNISMTLRTGAHDQGVPLNRKQLGNVIFDLDPGGADFTAPVTITPYINGEAVAESAIHVTGVGRQQVPIDLTDFFAFNTEYEVTWTRQLVGSGLIVDPVLFQYDTLWFLEPVGVVHWQSQPTSFGFPGFVHCRDAYIAIRSQAAVVLTMTIDGVVTQTYNIPSTAGARLKQYIQFSPNKGLLYQFSLDSVAEFRVYEPDLEIRVKPWLGVLGYATQRVLGGEVNA